MMLTPPGDYSPPPAQASQPPLSSHSDQTGPTHQHTSSDFTPQSLASYLSPQPKSIHWLPHETLSQIFELAHDPFSPRTILSACLVCRAWREPAQRVLFRDLVIPVGVEEWKGRLKRFQEREERLRWKARVTLANERDFMKLENGADEFRCCRGVRELTVAYVILEPAFLEHPDLQGKFASLSGEGVDFTELPTFQPDLEHLTIRSGTWFHSDVSSLPSTPVKWPPNLTSLSIQSDSGAVNVLENLQRHFGDMSSLTNLNLELDTNQESDALNRLNPLLEILAGNLRHTEVTLMELDDPDALLPCLQAVPSLKQLTLNFPSSNNVTTSFLDHLGRRLPPTVRVDATAFRIPLDIANANFTPAAIAIAPQQTTVSPGPHLEERSAESEEEGELHGEKFSICLREDVEDVSDSGVLQDVVV
ncbi:hypothetical protein P7C70_g5176, partial [Phenoliferia sp. Uapishka_3]